MLMPLVKFARHGGRGKLGNEQFRGTSVRVVRVVPFCAFSEPPKGASNPLKLRLGA